MTQPPPPDQEQKSKDFCNFCKKTRIDCLLVPGTKKSHSTGVILENYKRSHRVLLHNKKSKLETVTDPNDPSKSYQGYQIDFGIVDSMKMFPNSKWVTVPKDVTTIYALYQPDYTNFQQEFAMFLNKLEKIMFSNKCLVYGQYIWNYMIEKVNISSGGLSFFPDEKNDFDYVNVWCPLESLESLKTQLSSEPKVFLSSEKIIDKTLPFHSEKLTITMNDFQVDLVLISSKRFPINDFVVNLLTFDGESLKSQKGISILGNMITETYSVEELIQYINEKKTKTLPDFSCYLNSINSASSEVMSKISLMKKVFELV